MCNHAANLLRRAFESDDVEAVEAAIGAHPELLNCRDSRPVVTLARTVNTAERVLALGADMETVSKWWSGGMGLRKMDQGVATFLVQHGAKLTPHAAAGLGLVERLAEMLDANPSLIDAKGGDGWLLSRPEGAALLGKEAALFELLGDRPAPDKLLRALAGAAKGGHAALCHRLLEAGAPVSGTLDGNNTPLAYALKSGSADTVAILQEHGA